MAPRETDFLTHAEYARHRKALRLPGSSREAVSNAVKEGRISTINGKIHPLIADAEWARNTRARVSPQAAAQPPEPSSGDLVIQAAGVAPVPAAGAAGAAPAVEQGYNIHRAKREKADAEIAAMTAAKMAGELVQREDVARATFEVARALRDHLTSCAGRVGAEVASLTTAEACEQVIAREHRIVLEMLASFCRERSLSGPEGVAA